MEMTKRKWIAGDATLDHLAKAVADLGGKLLDVHNTESSINTDFLSPQLIANL